jgi:signal transduction histidine kinase
VTEHVEKDLLDHQLQPLYGYLMQAEKFNALTTLTPGFAHDAGTPLMAISSLAQLLKERGSDPQILQKLAQIEQSVDRITQIIRTIVDFSKRIRPEREKVYLNSLVVEAIRIIKHDRRLKYREVQNDLVAQIPQVSASADQLLQVIIALCLNSADALESVPNGTLVLKSWHDQQFVYLSITDTGIGIAAENVPLLFTPFFTTKGAEKGSGLGLYLSRAVIMAHGGKIDLQSEPDKGTTVVLALPALDAGMGA